MQINATPKVMTQHQYTYNFNDEFFEIENCKSTLAWLITNTIKDIAIIHPPYTLSKWIINCISNKNSLNPCNFCPTNNHIKVYK